MSNPGTVVVMGEESRNIEGRAADDGSSGRPRTPATVWGLIHFPERSCTRRGRRCTLWSGRPAAPGGHELSWEASHSSSRIEVGEGREGKEVAWRPGRHDVGDISRRERDRATGADEILDFPTVEQLGQERVSREPPGLRQGEARDRRRACSHGPGTDRKWCRTTCPDHGKSRTPCRRRRCTRGQSGGNGGT